MPEPENEAEFESGIFVLNEGNFGSANASVSFINMNEGQNKAQVFNSINGYSLGDTAQSIEMHESMALIVVNVSNKIEVVNRYTFQSLGSIQSNLDNPRFAEVVGERIFVTNWGDGMDAEDDFVSVFNLSDLSFIDSIPVSEGPEKIIASGEKLFVAHKGGFSFNNIVSQINAESLIVETEIEVGDVPVSIVLDGNDLWVLSSGKPSYADNETAGQLSKIDVITNEVTESYEYPQSDMHPANLKLSGNKAYFTIDKAVFELTPGEELPATSKFEMEEVEVLYGFEIYQNMIYVASPHLDFTGDGSLYIYDLSEGRLIEKFTTGINPNGIYFN
ncbi:hypothetical protein GCM10023115_50270 [Pontixanthobacter gangjinensis]